MRSISVLIGLTLCSAPFVYTSIKIGGRLNEALLNSRPEDQIVVWVFLTDKGQQTFLKLAHPESLVSPRSLQRRAKVRSAEELVDFADLPIERGYVNEITSLGARLRQCSKWFNAVSFVATPRQLELIIHLPFVRNLELVWRARRERDLANYPVSTNPPPALQLNNSSRGLAFDYGPSLPQVQLINVPAVHNTGNYGQGVVIGSFDNGFRLLTHEAFDTLRPRIIATYDFVDHKVSVNPNAPEPNFGAHGIVTLSTLGGFKPGELIGPAFGASFVLARTENDSSETPIEEDNWLAAMEWADSIGVDITTTSLGYLTYDPPYTSWTWQNMTGHTTLISRAGNMAASRGIVVMNSAGNNGYNASHNTLNAPADGDSVIAVGATNSDGTRAGFSSVGPTTGVPPRFKPDIMAQGVAIHCASPSDPHGYVTQQGTSLSCPLAAGVAALILHARPTATPTEVLDILRATASQANSPDNLMGWGIINAAAAVNVIPIGSLPSSAVLYQSYPNPFPTPIVPLTTISFVLPEQARVTLKIIDILGQEVRTLVTDDRTMGFYPVKWDGKNSSGRSVASGVYLYVLNAVGSSGRTFFEMKKLAVVR